MFSLNSSRRRGARLALLLAASCCSLPALAAEWVKVESQSFDMISQLDARTTRAWAVELEQFVSALRELDDTERAEPAPLTVVLFRQQQDFAPYRLRTDSGQAEISGFFGNTGDFAIIGLPADNSGTRQTIYHEAVHWLMSTNENPQPLWLSEGVAEVASTFRIVDGKARFGEPIADNVELLTSSGLLPLEGFLLASQDDTLHGDPRGKYYPQAWALVHYLAFGAEGADARELRALLQGTNGRELDTARGTAFGKPYRRLTNDLRRHLEQGGPGYAEVAIEKLDVAPDVEVAADADVEFALGRLALVGDNLELAAAHAERLVALAPDSPAGHEVTAYTAHALGDLRTLHAALDRAREQGSQSSWIYATAAERMVSERQRDGARLDELLPPDTARAAADLYRRALELKPSNATAFSGLVLALLNVDALTGADAAALNEGYARFPTDGVALVGQAAAARSRGDLPEAARLLGRAMAAPYTIPRRYRKPVAALRVSWFGEWFLEEVAKLTERGRFTDARELVAEHLADDTITGPLRKMLETLQRDLPQLERERAVAATAAR